MATSGGTKLLSGTAADENLPRRSIPENSARDNVLHDIALVPESVEDAEDHPRSTDEPTFEAKESRPVGRQATSRHHGPEHLIARGTSTCMRRVQSSVFVRDRAHWGHVR